LSALAISLSPETLAINEPKSKDRTLLTTYRGGQKLLAHNDSTVRTPVAQPSLYAARRRYVYKRRKLAQNKRHGNRFFFCFLWDCRFIKSVL